MTIWETLGIDPTQDKKAIQAAFSAASKHCRPEEDPEGFAALRDAYKAAMSYAAGVTHGFIIPAPPPQDDGQAPPKLVFTEAPESYGTGPEQGSETEKTPAAGGESFDFKAAERLAGRKQAEELRYHAQFIKALNDINGSKSRRGNTGAWKSVLYAPGWEDRVKNEAFTRLLISFLRKAAPPPRVCRVVLIPFIASWKTFWKNTPYQAELLSLSNHFSQVTIMVSKTQPQKPWRSGPLVMAVAIVLLFLIIRAFSGANGGRPQLSHPIYSSVIPSLGLSVENSLAQYLPLDDDDYFKLSAESSARNDVLAAIEGQKAFSQAGKACASIELDEEAYEALVRQYEAQLGSSGDIGAALEAVKNGLAAYAPVEKLIIEEKIHPWAKGLVVSGSISLDEQRVLLLLLGIESAALANLMSGAEENGEEWLDGQLSGYSRFLMSLASLMLISPTNG